MKKSQTYNVIDTLFTYHVEPDGSTVFQICYVIDDVRCFSEYLNFEHPVLRKHAEFCWRRWSCDAVPQTNEHAADIANYHGLAIMDKITVEYGEYGYKISNHRIGEEPIGIDEIW
ncbi:MAG: hypothetical protein LBC20_02995 [Planctomycetaceae bacterium]|jgi:hypothetical protein|nr:hypothetical protein [Planctomycetaceae bacterium]